METDKTLREIKTPVWAIQVDLTCNKCEGGKMILDGNRPHYHRHTSEPIFVYTCNRCGEKELNGQKYPYIEHIPLEEIIPDIDKLLESFRRDGCSG